MLLPHYQLTKDEVLDGKRLFEDITYTDSIGRKFYAIVDGSFLFIEDGSESLFGEAYLIENGEISKISSVGDAVSL
jgi:dipeptidase E